MRRNLAVVIPWTVAAALAVALLLVVFLPTPGARDVSADDDTGASATTAAQAADPDAHSVTVNFVLNDAETAASSCVGEGGFGDIGPGTPVTIKNGSGEILGAGSLGVGSPQFTGGRASGCLWVTTLSGVPTNEAFYSAEVGRRGAVTESRADLQAAGWKFELSLGN
ncbi:hypothetical protein [Petropleomorpha daqingensis]|uniref:hypothetical protein n=1 Tax=Petropleomorpha daqingensis TaxID=2026353 RepID=UPI0015CC87F4|nr:hypothetical protein [Petropleomorpha daqingensis]